MCRLLITGILLLSVLISGCESYVEKLRSTKGYENVRVDGAYLMYEMEEGSVTCREHNRRSELACWRN